MSDRTTYYQRNREIILNRIKKYENNKESLRQYVRSKYRALSNEEKEIKGEYGRNRYYSMPDKSTEILKEYQKDYCNKKNQTKSLNFL